MCLFLTRHFDEKLKNIASFEGKPQTTPSVEFHYASQITASENKFVENS